MRKKVLIVDDDDDIRELISIILSDDGFMTIELDNGRTVLKTVDETKPDIILLDVMLGDSDGRDICKELKDNLETKDIPVIIISATHGLETRSEKNCGADHYIKKPFDISELSLWVSRYTS